MVRIWLLLLPTALLAEQGGDGRALLQQVVEAARNMKGWRAEAQVTFEMQGDGANTKAEVSLKDAVLLPGRARREMSLMGVQTLLVCDGAATWTYFPNRNQYSKSEGIAATCGTSPLSNWRLLLDGLESAEITGQDTVIFQGKSAQCEVVRAEYSKLPAGFSMPGGQELSGSGSRTFCIDRQRSLILRDRVDALFPAPAPNTKPVEVIGNIVYSDIERDPRLAPGLFVFTPPPGSTVTGAQQPGGVPAGSKNIVAPVMIHKVDPDYTAQARAAKIEGSVVLEIEIGLDGATRVLKVVRSLDPGLDRNAAEAASKWRFRPGTMDGKPITVRVQVEVPFRLK